MPRICDLRLTWTPSPSGDIDHVAVITTINGQETTTDFPGNMTSQPVVTEVPASSSVSFRVDTFDTEGNTVSSETHSFTVGDLVDPLPATGLGHVIENVRDAGSPPPVTGKK